MQSYVLNVFLFRILLPIIIATCLVFRPSGLSAIYLLLLCYLPFVPVPTEESLRGHTGLFFRISIMITVLTATCQLAFQLVLLLMPPYGYFLDENPLLEKILRHAGFVRLDDISLVAGFTWLTPEIVMLIAPIVFFSLLKKLNGPNLITISESQSLLDTRLRPWKEYLPYLIGVGRYGVLAMLCLAAIARPSIPGGLYYLVFLCSATWWACYKQLRRGFAIVLCCLIPIVFLHICCLYAYQFQWPQEILAKGSPYARYFGLTPLIIIKKGNSTIPANTTIEARNQSTIDMSGIHESFDNDTQEDLRDYREFVFSQDAEWASFANPFLLYSLYVIIILASRELLKPEMHQNQQKEATETTPLIRTGIGSKKNSEKKSGAVIQDSTGSVTVTGEVDDTTLDEYDGEYEAHWFENVIFFMGSILQIIVRSSYIVTNIIMMAWSITYLSWLTFVLLLWANLIWLIPKQRKNMLHSSPFLVTYAWFLLLSAYIYSMDLNNDELPANIDGVDLSEIGFVKVDVLPCGPLFVKCLYTVMFWVTLRQYMQERAEARQSSALADMVAPLQVSVGTAAGVNQEQEKNGNKVMQKIGPYLKRFFTKFWIWVVAVTLFAVAITGERMTVFRIVYMALFLFFILSFQFSFDAWRKIMFGFWLTVIIYSMIILVLVYTYQFKKFPSYWASYLHIHKEQQLDIGLEQYKTKQLFVRLVTPTFFVIVTVIQLHYFHKDFMALSDTKNTSAASEQTAVEDADQSSLQGGAYMDRSEFEYPSSSMNYENIPSVKLRKVAQALHHVKNLTFLFLELHMMKVLFLFAMLMSIYDKCAVYFLIVVFLPVAFIFGRPMQIFVVYASSLLVSLVLLFRMIYQIQYIRPGNWNVTCEIHNNPSMNETEVNIAPWLGFQKAEETNESLIGLVKWNVIYIVIVTLWSVVLVRQYSYRVSRGRPTTRAFFMFPTVTVADSNKDLTNFCKYMANYAFYKFGVELSLIMTVILIGVRMDGYAVLYGIWLLILFSLRRNVLSRVWCFYLLFVAFALPFQYFMAVGLPPNLCQEFPWDRPDAIWRGLQDWAFLLDSYEPPPVQKLVYDFLVLLLVSRQWVVFRIERRYAGSSYAGGSNESIIHQAEQKDFENPVPDFITFVRSYLDISKRAVLQSFLWVTLAVVFVAGTNSVNIFSIGYLLGAFVFLWHGSDFYLRPVSKIIKQWQLLLGYNVTVIFIKTVSQLLGCIYLYLIPSSCCFLVQILGIGCVRKFADTVPPNTFVDGGDQDLCEISPQYVGIAWDTVCFALLIFQMRIFNSYNFFHIVDDTKATTILASRGAELIEEMRMKTMQEQEEMERKVLEKIKTKMERIKANQQKIKGDRKLDHHFKDSVFGGRPKYRVKPPVTYKQAIRSGDYYMFDELDDEIDLLPEEKAIEEEDKSGKTDMGGIDEDEPRSVKIREIEEPKPGTSRDEDDGDDNEDLSDITDDGHHTTGQKILSFLQFIWAFIDSAMVSLTNFLNRRSRNYRYVLKILAKEKKILKEKTTYNVGVRLGPGQIWQPAGSYHSLLRNSLKSSKSGKSALVPSQSVLEGEELSSYDQPTVFRLMLAIWYTIMSRSEILCYFVIFLNQVQNANFISLPLPLMVFFWGSLTIPRPTKTFWVTIIAYTEVIVLLKCIFQFDLMPGNMAKTNSDFTSTMTTTNPYFPPVLMGLSRMDTFYAMWDLFLLLVVFFHRVLLKSMGIWSTSIPVTAAMLSDGDYVLENGQLVPLSLSSATSNTRGQDNDLPNVSEGTVTPVSDKSATAHDENVVSIKTRRLSKAKRVVIATKMAFFKYAEHLKLFMQQLLDPASRVPADVYSLMFLCDFVNFFVILFGYSSFGSQVDGDVSDYLQDNRVPALFLVMLILQFMLIVIDRGIYLRKNILAKLIFQLIQILMLHLWLFVFFPIITGKMCNTVVPPQMYYMMKCFYLLFSAYQIRCGYPTRILGNFLCKSYGYVNMFLFKGFMLVPFLFELRTCMDWMWTATSMSVFDWIKMEDIYSHIFLLKCARHVENEYPQPRGEEKKPLIKYFMGGAILAVIIGIIWFPLVFFSLGNAVGEANLPSDVTVEIRIGPYEPVYKMSAQSNSIFGMSSQQLEDTRMAYNAYPVSETFLYNYEAVDVAAVKLSLDSANIWAISPPDRKRMVSEINSTNDLKVRLDYKVSHKTSKPEDSGILSNFVEIRIPPSSESNDTSRANLLKMLEAEEADPVHFLYLLPKFLKITSKGTVAPVEVLMVEKPVPEAKMYRNITLRLLRQNISQSTNQEWWHIQEDCGSDFNYVSFLDKLPNVDCDNSIVIYTFNDKVFPPTLNFITAGGILGLYTTLVFVASRILRGFFADGLSKIMFEDMPNVDRVLQLCLDIYLVREVCEFVLEEDLFAKLVFLFRSPETLIKWTRPKEEVADDDDPEGDGE